MTVYTALLTFLVITVYISNVNGCSCMQETNEHKFCRAKYAFQGKVIYVKTGRTKVRYLVKNMNSLKFRENQKLRIYSDKNFAMCGQRFQKGQIYLITGHKTRHGRYETNNCWWNTKWSDIPSHTRTVLERGKFATCKT